MGACVFYEAPLSLNIGSIKTGQSLPITTLTALLSLLCWAAMITDGNSTVLSVCVCVCAHLSVGMDVPSEGMLIVSGNLIISQDE